MKLFWVRRVDYGPGGTDAHGASGHVFISVENAATNEREFAKRSARKYLGGDPDRYLVDPLTNPNEPVWFEIGAIK